MKPIFIHLFFLLSVAYHAQNDNIKLVFSNTSDEAKSEIRIFLSSNPEFIDEFRQIEQSNHIFLSKTQYNKIQDYVNNFENNDAYKIYRIIINKVIYVIYSIFGIHGMH